MNTSGGFLLDGNVLIALATQSHAHYEKSLAWFLGVPVWATCPITQGTLIRFFYQTDLTPTHERANELLRSVIEQPGHRFITDALGYNQIGLQRIQGHRQVTDAYLVALADANGLQFATLDRGVKALYPQVEFIGS